VAADLQVSSGKRGGSKRSAVRPSMNVTPLVDVVLVLLIIFMVITPMLVKQLSVNVPTKPPKDQVAEPASPDDEPQIVLRVERTGLVYINKLQVPDEHLNVRLKRVFAARADQTLFFDADDAVPFERALAVLDIARGTGLATIAVLTEPVLIQ
jgi:biopolymer transport protein ExbD